MILSDKQIKAAVKSGEIEIGNFDESKVNPNSYDVTLGSDIAFYKDWLLDMKKEHKLCIEKIPESGFLLEPNKIYLGCINEYLHLKGNYVAQIEGKSSVGRLGVEIHRTAGYIDTGFCGHITLEISVLHPIIVYPNVPIAQLIFFKTGEVERNYAQRKTSKYNGQPALPVASKFFENFNK